MGGISEWHEQILENLQDSIIYQVGTKESDWILLICHEGSKTVELCGLLLPSSVG